MVNAKDRSERVGFIGLGTMGEPMARNLSAKGFPLVVWNRSPEPSARLKAEGASVGDSPRDVFADADVVILMLSDESATDSVLDRGTESFARLCEGSTIVNMATTATDYSASLASDVRAAGGAYVEAPVSGSRVPAERGELVAMLAGREEDVERVRPILDAMCSQLVYCGPEPSALSMKHASNMVLLPVLAGVAESMAFARRAGLDLEQLANVLLGGQLANDVLRAKVPKFLAEDYSAQAAIKNALESVRRTVRSAEAINVATPVTRECFRALERAVEAGFGEEDAIALEKTLVTDRSS